MGGSNKGFRRARFSDTLHYMMDLTTLNGTRAQPLCFGAMQFGGTADIVASQSMYADCRAAGINFFDTAYVYTGGQSETMLGRFAASERDDVLIATKAAYDKPATKDNVLASFEESRTRMNIDTIDLMYLHRFDDATPLQDSLSALAELREDGLIRYISGRLISDSRYNARYNVPWMHDCARDLSDMARTHGVSPATLAVAWAAKNPHVAAPIISARSSEQLAPSLAALSFDMSDALYDQITALSQAPAPATDRLEEA